MNVVHLLHQNEMWNWPIVILVVPILSILCGFPGENMPDWMLGLRETAPGMEGTSGRDAFGDTNPFDVHFPDPAEPAGDSPALPGDESNTDAVLSPPTVLPAEFVRELVPAEGHMINPMSR